MDIYSVLKKDHEKVLRLLNEVIALKDDDSETAKRLVTQIRDELVPHSRAEEAVFYNTLREHSEGKELAKHSFREHMEAEALLRTLQTAGYIHLGWKETAKKLKGALSHHIAEEEDVLFPAAKQLISDEEAKDIGRAFRELKSKVREQTIVGTTIDMVVNMMPTRLRVGLESFLHKRNQDPQQNQHA